MVRTIRHQLASLILQPRRRKYPIRRDEKGQSARARAFQLFDQGLRPMQLPDLGVSQRTLFRYFESWKHRDDEMLTRLATRQLRESEELQRYVAAVVDLDFVEIKATMTRRNPIPAIQRAIRDHLTILLRSRPALFAEEVEHMARLLAAYHGRDRLDLLQKFLARVQDLQRARDARIPKEVFVRTMLILHEDIIDLKQRRQFLNRVIFSKSAVSRAKLDSRASESQNVLDRG